MENKKFNNYWLRVVRFGAVWDEKRAANGGVLNVRRSEQHSFSPEMCRSVKAVLILKERTPLGAIYSNRHRLSRRI